MNNYLLTPPLLFFVFFCFPPPPPPHTFAELIPSQVYAFSIFEYSDCYNFNEMIEFSLWKVIRQLLARCFSDGCFDRRLLGISAICLFTSCEIATGAWNGSLRFCSETDRHSNDIKLCGICILTEVYQTIYKWTCSESDFFRHTRISFDIFFKQIYS